MTDHTGNTLQLWTIEPVLSMQNSTKELLDMMTHFGVVFTLQMAGDADAESGL